MSVVLRTFDVEQDPAELQVLVYLFLTGKAFNFADVPKSYV